MWQHCMEVPIFSTPVVDTASSNIIMAAVSGKLVALSHLGEVMWHCNLPGQVYAPLCLVSEQGISQPPDIVTSEDIQPQNADTLMPVDLHHSSQPENTRPKVVPSVATSTLSTEAQTDVDVDMVAAGSVIVVGDNQGQLHSVDALSGQLLSMHSMQSMHSMESAISTAATCLWSNRLHRAGTTEQHLSTACDTSSNTSKHAAGHSSHYTQQAETQSAAALMSDRVRRSAMCPERLRLHDVPLLVSCTNQGVMRLLQLDKLCQKSDAGVPLAQHSEQQDGSSRAANSALVAAVQMPGEVLTSSASPNASCTLTLMLCMQWACQNFLIQQWVPHVRILYLHSSPVSCVHCSWVRSMPDMQQCIYRQSSVGA